MSTVNLPADPQALAAGMLAQQPRAKATVGAFHFNHAHPRPCALLNTHGILLDANENAFGHSITRPSSSFDEGEGVVADLQTTLDLDLHRYPDP